MRCTVLNNLQKRRKVNGFQQIDSPLQVQLIKFLGLKNYFVDKFIFKRKLSKYKLCIRENVPAILMPDIYQPHQKLNINIKLIQTSSHSIPLVILTHKQPIDNYIIIYSHGNSSDLSDSVHFIENIALNFNIDTLAYDYSGYGQSRVSTIGEQTIVKDLEIIINWLDRPINKIILWGFSLGSYPTVCNSALYNVGAMVLIAPIASINCLFQDKVNVNSKFKEDYFSNFEFIDKVKCLTFITHSIQDQIIPIDHSRLLFEKFSVKNGKQKIWFLEIAKLNHNSLHKYFTSRFNNDLKEQFSSFLKVVRKNTKNAEQPPQRIKNRYLIVQSDLDQQQTFYQEDFQLQAISSQNQKNHPGRKFTEGNKKKIFPKCFDDKC